MSLDAILEKRVKILMDFRGYKALEKDQQKDGVRFLVETPKKNRLILWAIPASEAIGVRCINQVMKDMEKIGLDEGIVISSGHYTEAAKSLARRNRIELIPMISPAFNIFEHSIVPIHQILTPEEREEVLANYRVKPHQLPRIKASNPVARAIGAKAGDVVRIIRDSPTAGEYVSYRYVVEG